MGPLSQVHSHQLEKDPFVHIGPSSLFGVSEGLAVVASVPWGLIDPSFFLVPALDPSAQEHQHKPLSDKGLLAHCTEETT